MKTLITYSSLTGNTRKVAESIFNVIDGEKIMIPVSEVGELKDYDRVIVGFWVDKGDANQEARDFMALLENKTVGIFGTIGARPDSPHAEKCINNVAARVAAKNKVTATFLCQGAIDPKIIAQMLRMAASPDNPHPITEERKKLWQDAASHPDADDLENARKTFAVFNLQHR